MLAASWGHWALGVSECQTVNRVHAGTGSWLCPCPTVQTLTSVRAVGPLRIEPLIFHSSNLSPSLPSCVIEPFSFAPEPQTHAGIAQILVSTLVLPFAPASFECEKPVSRDQKSWEHMHPPPRCPDHGCREETVSHFGVIS